MTASACVYHTSAIRIFMPRIQHRPYAPERVVAKSCARERASFVCVSVCVCCVLCGERIADRNITATVQHSKCTLA